MDAENEPIPYKITKEDGSQSASSTDYTGKAQVEYPNRDTYDGDFLNGKKEGQGLYTYANGDKYTGAFVNDLKEGIGQIEYAKGGDYYGNFSKGKRSGQGVFTYANKDIYSGLWKDGLKHGKGTYIVDSCKLEGNNYSKLVGEWEAGEMLSGKWYLPNGNYYDGIYEKNNPKSKGTWNFTNGNKVEGEYSHSLVRDSNSKEITTKLSWKSNEEVFNAVKNKISS